LVLVLLPFLSFVRVTDRYKMADATPTNSPGLNQGAKKPSREAVKADRDAAKEAKRAAKAAAQAKKAASSGSASGPGPAALAGGANAANASQSSSKKQAQPATAGKKQQQQQSDKPVNPAATTSINVEGGERATSALQRPSSSKGKIPPSTNISTPSVLGGISLFGNVSTSTHVDEISQHVVAASYRSQVHPSVLKLAQHLSSFTIVGADARAIAVLKALRDFVVDYRTSSGAVFSRDLVTKLGPQIGFLVQSRPLGASVGHAIRYLKYEISVTPVELKEEEVSWSCSVSVICICRLTTFTTGKGTNFVTH
jgi:translation initiation factor eIF-2B subunit delta